MRDPLYKVRVEAHSKSINKIVKQICGVYRDVYSDDLEVRGNTPTERFHSILEIIRSEFEKGTRFSAEIGDEFGSNFAGDSEDILNSIRRRLEFDDVTPNQFYDCLLRVFCDISSQANQRYVDVPLGEVFRLAVADVRTRFLQNLNIRVGKNRHFPRMLSYVSELATELSVDGYQPLKIMNAAGAGRVSAVSNDPAKLKVRVDAEYFDGYEEWWN
ncbi:hypothetical protein [Oryzibacter oryziterrae]|uniref:hypothetical protein n=1 Tax=Oryzibacter oryziterrae TaxID=2766474 RepID=UPI001F421E13|nr:hypothetical protein [Oryzibacter oryziterrae]